jgi:hypothetical protein
VKPLIVGTGPAKAIAIKAGHWGEAAALQWLAKNVAGHGSRARDNLLLIGCHLGVNRSPAPYTAIRICTEMAFKAFSSLCRSPIEDGLGAQPERRIVYLVTRDSSRLQLHSECIQPTADQECGNLGVAAYRHSGSSVQIATKGADDSHLCFEPR